MIDAEELDVLTKNFIAYGVQKLSSIDFSLEILFPNLSFFLDKQEHKCKGVLFLK